MEIPDIKDPIPNLPGPEIEDNKLTAWDKLVIGLVFIAIPLALAAVAYIAGQREAKIRIPKPTKVYDYQIKQPDMEHLSPNKAVYTPDKSHDDYTNLSAHPDLIKQQ